MQRQTQKGLPVRKTQVFLTECFADFVLFPSANDCCMPFVLRNEEHGITLSDDILIVILELPKFKKSAEQISSPIDQWLYFLCHALELDSEKLPNSLKNSDIQRAIEVLVMLSQDDLERMRYQARQKALTDERSRLHSAHLEGVEEGLNKGREEGREEGRKEGLEEGREIARRMGYIENIRFCQKLLDKELGTEESFQGLSTEELKNLAQALQDKVLKSK